MPAWFDLYSLDPTGQEDDRGIEKSKQIITNLIEDEINNGIDPSRIVLGGFSQGGAIALTALSREPRSEPLAGCIALSTYFLILSKFFLYHLRFK